MTPLRRYSSRCGRAGVAATAIGALFLAATATSGATTCATVAACLFGNNTDTTASSTFASDSGVYGESTHGDGVDGVTKFNSTSALAKSGVTGIDQSAAGVHNNGVYGFSPVGTGMHGVTTGGTGVLGAATSANGVGVVAHAPIAGTALSVTQGSTSAFEPDTGTGLALTASGSGLKINALGDGVDVHNAFGYGLSVDAGAEGSGVTISTSENDGLDINTNGEIGEPYALFIDSNSPVQLLVSGLLSLDSSGNLIISGNLTQNGVPATLVRTISGRSLKTYGPREADATIEDVGEATITQGRAAVALDPAFASTLDPRQPYFVFLTAEGDNRGLYVALKTSRGFVIRECNGGASTLNVQYRIVARPYDAATTIRLQSINLSTMPYDNAAVRAHVEKLRAQAATRRAQMAALHS